MLPNDGKSLRRRMSTFWYGNVPGTVKPEALNGFFAKSVGLQNRPQPSSSVFLPPRVTRPDHWIPKRYGTSVIQLPTTRYFSLFAECFGNAPGNGNEKLSPG